MRFEKGVHGEKKNAGVRTQKKRKGGHKKGSVLLSLPFCKHLL
jgi:hypothetical protein